MEEANANLEPKQRESIKMISASSRLLQSIVDDVLDYSKLQSGNAEVDIQKCDVQAVVQDLTDSMRSSVIARKRNISIETRFDPLVSRYIETDGRRLLQIMFNLTSNAIKYSKTDGTVQVRLFVADKVDNPSAFRRDRESTTSRNDNGYDNPQQDEERVPLVKFKRSVLRITVKDFGKGIDKSNFDTIFQPFTQTNAGVRNIEGGTGLGLAITEKLVKALGGDISVDSCLHQWTEFTVDLPYRESEPPITTFSVFKRFQRIDVFCISHHANVNSNNDGILPPDEEIRTNMSHLDNILEYFGIEPYRVPTMALLYGMLKEQFNPNEEPHGMVCRVPAHLLDKSIAERLAHRYGMKMVVIGKIDGLLLLSNDDGAIIQQYSSITEMIPHVFLTEIAQLGQLSLENPTLDLSKDNNNNNNNNNRENGKLETTAASAASCDLSMLRVLCAEDNYVNQKILVRMLNRLGVTKVVMVENGQLVVEAEARQEFDIVLMDMQMPVMDGIEAAKLILQRRGGSGSSSDQQSNMDHDATKPRLPLIVFVTAHVASSFEQECMAAGGTSYLAKPYTLPVLEQTLLKTVAKLKEQQRQQQPF